MDRWFVFLPASPVETRAPAILVTTGIFILLSLVTMILLGHLLTFHIYLCKCFIAVIYTPISFLLSFTHPAFTVDSPMSLIYIHCARLPFKTCKIWIYWIYISEFPPVPGRLISAFVCGTCVGPLQPCLSYVILKLKTHRRVSERPSGMNWLIPAWCQWWQIQIDSTYGLCESSHSAPQYFCCVGETVYSLTPEKCEYMELDFWLEHCHPG